MAVQKEQHQIQVSDDPVDFIKGCWIRTIRCSDQEINILNKREGIPVAELLGHDNQASQGYTHYSSCTFIKKGLPVSLFQSGNKSSVFGVFIRRFSRRIDWWYDGRKEVVTDDISVKPGKPYDNGAPKEYQRWNVSADEIVRAILSLYNEFANDIYYKENPDERVHLSWNEGKLRYKKDDITGILINPNSKQSVEDALKFRKSLGLLAPLYSYDDKSGKCKHHSSLELKTKHGLLAPTLALNHIPVPLHQNVQRKMAIPRNTSSRSFKK